MRAWLESLADYRSGRQPGAVMPQIVKGYSDLVRDFGNVNRRSPVRRGGEDDEAGARRERPVAGAE